MQAQISVRIQSRLRDLLALTKPEVNLLVIMTTSAGYYVASRGPLRILGLLNTLIGTLLVASGTATLNQWMERSWDAAMRRTAGRPLPSGRLSARAAFLFGVALSVTGVLYLELTATRSAALLALATLLSYLLIYTPLKRKTPLCTLIGAFPGATPVLIGSAGASAGICRQAWLLFAIVFLWQFPHFLAIALMYRDDYALAGFKMLPQFDSDSKFTRAEIVVFTTMLIVTTALPRHSGGWICLGAKLLAGGFFLYHAARLSGSASTRLASRVVHASVIYLPVILALMVAWN